MRILTPNAEKRFERRFCALSRKTSDLGLGGRFGLRMTRTSSPISSSSSFESEDVEPDLTAAEQVVVVAEDVILGCPPLTGGAAEVNFVVVVVVVAVAVVEGFNSSQWSASQESDLRQPEPPSGCQPENISPCII